MGFDLPAESYKRENAKTEDRNKDGKPDVWYWNNSKTGKRKYLEADKNYNGKIDLWMWYFENGGVKKDMKDGNNDGKPDSYAWYNFRTNKNNKLKLIKYEQDTNYDGKIDKWLTFWPNGKRKEEIIDINYDDTPDTWYYYNKKGIAKRKEIDKTNNGKPNIVIYFEKDGETSYTLAKDRNNDGILDLWLYWKKNPSGTKSKIIKYAAEDKDGDGKPDKKISFHIWAKSQKKK